MKLRIRYVSPPLLHPTPIAIPEISHAMHPLMRTEETGDNKSSRRKKATTNTCHVERAQGTHRSIHKKPNTASRYGAVRS